MNLQNRGKKKENGKKMTVMRKFEVPLPPVRLLSSVFTSRAGHNIPSLRKPFFLLLFFAEGSPLGLPSSTMLASPSPAPSQLKEEAGPNRAVPKIPEGGWIPLILSIFFMCVMYIWNYGALLRHEFDLQNKVSAQRILALGPNLGLVRVPGVGVVRTGLAAGVPAVFGHFAMILPAFHQVLIFVCTKSVQVPFIPEQERFLVGMIGAKAHRMFICVVRYGYKELRQENYDFENRLLSELLSFVEMEEVPKSEENAADLPFSPPPEVESIGGEESVEILKAKESGVVHISGHSYARASNSSSLMKRLAIDVLYAFLSKNCRADDVQLSLPHSMSLKVGMVYYV